MLQAVVCMVIMMVNGNLIEYLLICDSIINRTKAFYTLCRAPFISVGKTPTSISGEYKHICLSGGTIHQLR